MYMEAKHIHINKLWATLNNDTANKKTDNGRTSKDDN